MEEDSIICSSSTSDIRSTNVILPLPPTTTGNNSTFFPTVFEEEPSTFSQTSSDNDEYEAIETFVEESGAWCPSNDDVGILQDQTSHPNNYRNDQKPRRRLPMVTQAVSRAYNSNEIKEENGSCSFDSGLSRLLSSVDKAVSSVTHRTIKKAEDNQIICGPSKKDKKSILQTSSIISFAHTLTPCQSPPMSSPVEKASNSTSNSSNSLCVDTIFHNQPSSPSKNVKTSRTYINSRRFSDHFTNDGLCLVKNNETISTNETSQYLSRHTNLFDITNSIPNSPVRSRQIRNNTSTVGCPTSGKVLTMYATEVESLKDDINFLTENKSTIIPRNYNSPPLSPSIPYGSTVSSSPKLARIGRRMLPETPKNKTKHSLQDKLMGSKCQRESANTLEDKRPDSKSSTGLKKTSMNDSFGVLLTSNAKSRPSGIKHFNSYVIASEEEPQDHACLNDTYIPPASNSNTQCSMAAGSTWHAVSSRDSLDSGFFSNGHSRSTTCDSTNSNISGVSLSGTGKGSMQEIVRNPSSPNSNELTKSISSNERTSLFERQYRLMTSQGVRLQEISTTISGSNEGLIIPGSFNIPMYNSDSVRNAMRSNSDNNVEFKLKQSIYNRVQSLPSQDTSEISLEDLAPLHHQQSLPSKTHSSSSSDIETNVNCSIDASQFKKFTNVCGDSFGQYLNFNSCVPSSTNSDTIHEELPKEYSQNNQRNLGAHDILYSQICDYDHSYYKTSPDEQSFPSERNKAILKTDNCKDSLYTSSTQVALNFQDAENTNQKLYQSQCKSKATNNLLVAEDSISNNDTFHQTNRTCNHGSSINYGSIDWNLQSNFNKYLTSNADIYDKAKIKESDKKSPLIRNAKSIGHFSLSDKTNMRKFKENDNKDQSFLIGLSDDNKLNDKIKEEKSSKSKCQNNCAIDSKNHDITITENHSCAHSLELEDEDEFCTKDKNLENITLYHKLKSNPILQRNYEDTVFPESRPSDSGTKERNTSASYRRLQWLSVQKHTDSG